MPIAVRELSADFGSHPVCLCLLLEYLLYCCVLAGQVSFHRVFSDFDL